MTGTKRTIAMLSGAAALAFAVGFGGVGISSLDSATTPTTHPAASAAPAPGVHVATLTGIAFANPGHPQPPAHPHSQQY
jgi:hypothetical protein